MDYRIAEVVPFLDNVIVLFTRPVPRNEYPAPVQVVLRGRCPYLSGVGDAMPSRFERKALELIRVEHFRSSKQWCIQCVLLFYFLFFTIEFQSVKLL